MQVIRLIAILLVILVVESLSAVYFDGVEASSDDCIINGSSISLTGANISMGAEGGGTYEAGVRFTGATVPQGSTFSSAQLYFYSWDDYSTTNCDLIIRGELIADAATFTTNADFVARTRTSNSVAWDNVGSWSADFQYTSPELTTIMNEIVGQGSWASGNDFVLFINDNGSTNLHYRRAYAYDAGLQAIEFFGVYTTPAGATGYISLRCTKTSYGVRSAKPGQSVRSKK